MLLDDLLDLGLVQVVGLLILQVENDLCATAKLLALGVGCEGEGSTGTGLPDILLIIIVLRNDGDAVGDEVCGVETNTKLTNHGNISACGQGLHELLGARSCDRTEVVDEILRMLEEFTVGWQITYSLGHANTSVTDCEGLVLLVGDDVDTQILTGLKLT